MDLEMAWTITRKDLGTFRKKKSIFYSTILLPLILSVGLPAVIWAIQNKSANIPDATLINLSDAFSFVFIIFTASVIPAAIASYSIVGEKVEKSLEPLLATPATDGEILLGKSLAAFIPSFLATLMGVTVFMVLIDSLISGQLGYLYYPNLTGAIILLVIAPLIIMFSVGLNVLVSSKVNDVRTAYQVGALGSLPFGIIYVASEIGLIQLNTTNLVILFAILLVVDAALLYLGKATFRREEILTKWK